MVDVVVDSIVSSGRVLSLEVVDSFVFEFHCRSSFDASRSKKRGQEGTVEYERTQQVQ